MDWNQDGKLDVIAGDTEGSVWLFLNVGTRQKPVLAAGVKLEADGKAITATRQTYKQENEKYVPDRTIPGSDALALHYSKLHVADWNGDGLADLLIGHDDTIVLYRNVGTRKEPRLAAPVKIEIPEGRFPVRPSPCVVDWDGDGKKDLVVGCENAQVMLYRNTGTSEEPKLAKGETLALPLPAGAESGYRWRLDVTDWNGDGKLDLLVGNFASGPDRKMGGNIWLFLAE